MENSAALRLCSLSIREIAELRNPMYAVNMGNPSSGSLGSLNIKEFTWERDPHGCSIRGKAHTTKSRLTKHQKIHTGEKPYVYAKCGKAFLIESCIILPQKTQTGEKPSTCRLWKWFHPEGQFHCTLEQSIGDEKW